MLVLLSCAKTMSETSKVKVPFDDSSTISKINGGMEMSYKEFIGEIAKKA